MEHWFETTFGLHFKVKLMLICVSWYIDLKSRLVLLKKQALTGGSWEPCHVGLFCLLKKLAGFTFAGIHITF